MLSFSSSLFPIISVKFTNASLFPGRGTAPRYGVIFPRTGIETLLGCTITYVSFGKLTMLGINASAAALV